MRYRLEVDSKKEVEVLTVNGKEYKRTWTYQGGGVTACDKNEISEMMLSRVAAELSAGLSAGLSALLSFCIVLFCLV